MWAERHHHRAAQPGRKSSGSRRSRATSPAPTGRGERPRALMREQLGTRCFGRSAQLMALLEKVPAVVNFLRGPDLSFEFAHPQMVLATGGRELLGKPLLVAMPEYRDQPVYASIRRVYETGEPWSQKESLACSKCRGKDRDVLGFGLCGRARSRGAHRGRHDVRHRRHRECSRPSGARASGPSEGRLLGDHEPRAFRRLSTRCSAGQRCFGATPRTRRKSAENTEIIQPNGKAQARIMAICSTCRGSSPGKFVLNLCRADIAAVVHAAADVLRPGAEARGPPTSSSTSIPTSGPRSSTPTGFSK